VIRHSLDDHPVLVIAASAGAGKTTATIQAVTAMPGPVAWVSCTGVLGAQDADTSGELLLRRLAVAVEPHAPGAVTALAAARRRGAGPAEAVTLLGSIPDGTGLTLVIDAVHELENSSHAVAVLAALVLDLAPKVRLVLVCRADLPRSIRGLGDVRRVAFVGDTDLAFTVTEAAEALRPTEREHDAQQRVDATQGWITGVLYDWWETDPEAPALQLDRLSADLLGQLTGDETTLLIHTSLLDEVTAESASALGIASADRVMASLRRRRLPLTWSSGGSRMVALPRFRQHLQRGLGELAEDALRALRRRYARSLEAQGRHEEAVAELLMTGDTDNARRVAEQVLPGVLGRLDLATAQNWLDRMRPVSEPPAPGLSAAGLYVAFGLEQCWRGVMLADQHGRAWWSRLAGYPGGAEHLALLVWCFWHVGRLDDARQVLEVMPTGRPRDIAAALLTLADDHSPAPLPELRDDAAGPLEGMLMRVAFWGGRLQELQEIGSHEAWRAESGSPWTIAALRAAGRISQAAEMYDALGSGRRPFWLKGIDAAELMADLGRRDDAWAALMAGREAISATGSRVYDILSLLLEAKLALRLDRDRPRAATALAEAERRGSNAYAFTRELAATWQGLELLLAGRDREAAHHLAAAVAGMRAGGRRLELPTAAIYLSEARWRLGDAEAADAAADLALDVATVQGSRHLLLQALDDVPAVAARRADAEPTHRSRWHELVSVLSTGSAVTAAGAPRLSLEEFGAVRLLADGQEVHVRLVKSVELLAYLLSRRGATARRGTLLEALFPGRSVASARSYLRQAVYRLREVLPDGVSLMQEGDTYQVSPASAVDSSSARFQRLLAEAGRQDGEDRLDTLLSALSVVDAGPYFASTSTFWLDSRRAELDAAVAQARIDAATVALRLGRIRETRRLAGAVLEQDPHREQAWRLALNAAEAAGADDELLDLYRGYVQAMTELGVRPSADIRHLVERLRR
jgi:DNA-binding SARP family transcriptional activator